MFWVLHYDCTMIAWIDGIGWSYSLDDHFLEGCCLDGCFLVVNLLMLGKLRLMVILQTSSKSKLSLQQNSLGETGCLSNFLCYLSIATDTPPWLLRPMKVSTSSELYPDYFQLPTFLDCSDIQYFYSPSFSNSHLGYL